MKYRFVVPVLAVLSTPLYAAVSNEALQKEILALQKQTQSLQKRLSSLQNQMQEKHKPKQVSNKKKHGKKSNTIHSTPVGDKDAPPVRPRNVEIIPNHTSPVYVQMPDNPDEAASWYPRALVADNRVVTWIASTPIVRSPYTGERPAFDGSDYLVNISSINRDVRLMEQRKKLYDAFARLGYPSPSVPIISLSGKLEPVASGTRTYQRSEFNDLTLGSAEVDVSALVNSWVEAFIAIAFDEGPPENGGPRVTNSSFDLNLGFINIGNLDVTPLYFTAGQLYAPYGRYSSAMVSSPLTLLVARNKTRPVILGYKTQEGHGYFGQLFGFKSDTTLGKSGNGGITSGFTFGNDNYSGEIGGSVVRSIDDADGMQLTFFGAENNFGGFGSPFRGNEYVKKIPGADIYGILRFDRYSFTAEWVGAVQRFRPEDLSFNDMGANPQAGQLEAGMTFMLFGKPASLNVGYQWTKDSLALGLPKRRYIGVFNISIWKDTVESIEVRRDYDYRAWQFGNGAAPFGQVNVPIYGTGGVATTVTAQIGVYF